MTKTSVKMPIKGSIAALVTPFHNDGSINFEKLAELVEFHIEHQTAAISILGTTGESPTIDFDEQKQIVKKVIQLANGRIHVNVGAGSNDTRKACLLAQTFTELGADSLLVITPYYNKSNDSGLYKHFTAIADSTDTPIIMYNVPSRTGVVLPVNIVRELSVHPHIAALKEASGDIGYAVAVSPYLSDDFAMYSGNDDMIVPLLSLGASGVISVLANIMPSEVQELVTSFADNPKHALALQQKYLPLIHSLFLETNPIPVKFAMNQLGHNVGPLRLPLDEASPAVQEKIIRELAAFF
ncbi:4-hydroxy-tetrahydrodipicolinate synthase [Lactovum odontotermitis]